MWMEISNTVGDRKLAGLTGDYGAGFTYWGWKSLTPWPTSGDIHYHVGMRNAQDDFEAQFEELALQRDLFVVTDSEDLQKQPFLAERLMDYSVFAQGNGYIIYDISQ